MKPRKPKPSRPKQGPAVRYSLDWEVPPPDQPAKLIRERVIGIRAGKPEKRGGKK